MIAATPDILSALNIDYSNIDEIYGYQVLMFKLYELEGGFAYPYHSSSFIREIQHQGLIWLRNVKDVIDGIISCQTNKLTLGAIPKLLSAYDLHHRLCKGERAADYIKSVRLQTAMRWAKGDKSISRTYLALELLKEIQRDCRSLDRKYSTFALRCVAAWIQELLKFGTFPDTPLDESYARLSFLIGYDLFAYLNPSREVTEKKRWIRTHLLSEEATDHLDSESLLSYYRFIQTVSHHDHLLDEHDTSRPHLLSKLASRPDIHPLLLQAIELELNIHSHP